MPSNQEILDAVKELQREVIACREEFESIRMELFKVIAQRIEIDQENKK